MTNEKTIKKIVQWIEPDQQVTVHVVDAPAVPAEITGGNPAPIEDGELMGAALAGSRSG